MADEIVRVLLAEDHPVYLEGLSAAIGGAPDLELAVVCEDGARALEGIRDARPDVAVLDLRLPILTAREVLQELAGDETTTRVLILSAHLDGDAIVDCVELGATGYMAKDATRRDILDAIRTVAGGQAVLSAEAQTRMAEAMRRRALAGEPLSAREREILELLAEGASAPEIARRLYLSPATVKTHLHNVYEKLGVSERAAAVAEGMRRGLIS
jgi:two-component system, NarL family, nitrate/nitrite response regulator NarL